MLVSLHSKNNHTKCWRFYSWLFFIRENQYTVGSIQLVYVCVVFCVLIVCVRAANVYITYSKITKEKSKKNVVFLFLKRNLFNEISLFVFLFLTLRKIVRTHTHTHHKNISWTRTTTDDSVAAFLFINKIKFLFYLYWKVSKSLSLDLGRTFGCFSK